MSVRKHVTPSKAARRAQLMTGAGTAVLVILSSSAGHAAETIVRVNPDSAQADAGLTAQSILDNRSRVYGGVSDVGGTIDSGQQVGATNRVTANTAAAVATGNTATTRIIDTDLLARPVAGEAALTMMSNSGNVSSRAADNQFGVQADTLADGTTVVSGNTISATAAANRSLTRVDALIPASAAPGMVGSITLRAPAEDGDQIDATGDTVVTNAQTNLVTGSATTVDNRIGIDVGLTGLATAAPVVATNTIAATYTGNTASNTAAMTAGGSPVFTGSMVVTNLQSNEAGEIPQLLRVEDTPGANNTASLIAASAGYARNEAPFAGSLAGSLSVAGNAITAATTGNDATGAGTGGNRILIADGVSVLGSGIGGAGSTTVSNFDNVAMTANADLAIVSSQRNGSTGVASAVTLDAAIVGQARSLIGGTVGVSANTIGADATGNVANSAVLTGTGAATFDATVAIASQQGNYDAGVSAASLGSATVASAGDIGFDGEGFIPGFVDNAAVSLTGNLDHATAYGNNATQRVSIAATTIPLSGGTAGLGSFGGGNASISVSGAVTVTNAQANTASPTAATVDGSLMRAQSDAFTTTDSRIEASGNTQEAVAIANAGTSGLALSGTNVGSGAGLGNMQINRFGSDTTASLTATAMVDVGDTVGSALVLTDNVQRAIAYGNSAANAISVAATELEMGVDTGGGNGVLFGGASAFGLLSQQQQEADIRATVDGKEGPSLAIAVDGNLFGGAANNDGNALVAAAYGNQASSSGTFALGGVVTPMFGFDAMSAPGVALVVNAQFGHGLVAAATGGGEMIGTAIDEDMATSSLSVSGNTVQALAYGNRANGNELTVTGTDIATVYAEGQPAFALGNLQQAFGGVTATQRSQNDATSIAASVDRNVTDSAIVLSDNIASTQATANAAANTLTLDASTLATTAQLSNVQYGFGQVSATAGQPAVAPGDGEPGRPSRGGVHVTVGGDIFGSSIKVADNSSNVGAVVNNAANALSARATAIGGGGTLAILNQQLVYPSESAVANVIGNYSVVGTAGSDIAQSTLTVSGNSQVANALGNASNNGLTLTATNAAGMGGETAIRSSQDAFGTSITASSDVTVAAPVSSTSSTIALTGNVNTALAAFNDVTNKALVSATNVTGSGFGLATADGNGTTTADYVVDTLQNASGSLQSTATTTIGNNDLVDAGVAGVLDGAVAITGNVTTAEASANRALNTANVTGSASQSVTAALSNRQTSNTGVSAVAATTAMVALNGGADPETETFRLALEGSSVALNGNTTTALARGNAATNAMTVSASSPVGIGRGPAPSIDGTSIAGTTATATAPAVVLNSQTNAGFVGAEAGGAYTVALNSGFGGSDAAGSSVAVSNNVVNAAAYGNTATNSLEIKSLNGNGVASGAVTNYQQNLSAITAAATQVTFGTTAPSGNFGSALAVGGNQIAATAIGNSAVTTVTIGR